MKSLGDGIITIAIAIIGLATLAVIVSKKSGTTDLVKATGAAFNNLLKTTLSPIN